jgi:cyanophycinase-like exopeptidase
MIGSETSKITYPGSEDKSRMRAAMCVAGTSAGTVIIVVTMILEAPIWSVMNSSDTPISLARLALNVCCVALSNASTVEAMVNSDVTTS